jgi:hypothetical protein
MRLKVFQMMKSKEEKLWILNLKGIKMFLKLVTEGISSPLKNLMILIL